MAQSMLNLDLGLSDDEEPAQRHQNVRGKREESVSELLSGKDSTMMFGGESPRNRSRKGFQFDMAGGGDPIDALKQSVNRRTSAPSPVRQRQQTPEMDDEELRFQMEFQREMGLLGGEGVPTQGIARRSPSPAVEGLSAGDGSDESLADIVGDILDDARPAKRSSPSPGRRQSSPPSFGAVLGERGDSARGTSRRGSSPGLTPREDDEDATPRSGGRPLANEHAEPDVDYRSAPGSRRASRSPAPGSPRASGAAANEQDRMPVHGRRDASVAHSDREGSVASERSLRGGRTQESMYAADESPVHGRDASSASVGARPPRKPPPRPQLDDTDPLGDILGDDTGGPRPGPRTASPAGPRTASPAMSLRGPATPTPSGRGTTDADVPQTPPAFDVELNVKPKRRLSTLGQAKAKASPAPSATRTPPPEEDVPARGSVATPASGRATPPPAAAASASVQEEALPGLGSFSATPPLPMDGSAAVRQTTSPSPSLPMDDDDDQDDLLLPDESTAPPQPSSAAPKDSSDSGLPEFLRAAPERRLRRGEQPSAYIAPSVPPKATQRAAPKLSPKTAAFGADLGLSAEDLIPSDNSASMSMLDKQAGAPEDASGSGSAALLDVPLSVKPKGGRRFPKAKARGGSSTLEDDILGSASDSASISPTGAHGGSALSRAQAPYGINAGSAPVGISGAGFQGSAMAGGTAFLPAANSAVSSSAASVPLEQSASPRHPAVPAGARGGAAPSHPGTHVPPGSPMTQTVQGESGVRPALATALTSTHRAGYPLPSDAHRQVAGGTQASEPALSLQGAGPSQGDHGARAAAGFAFDAAVTGVPSAELLSKLAYSEAKVRQLELQLEDCEQRWMLRVADAKQQSDAEHERMDMQSKRLDSELERGKEIHAADIRHLNEKKQLMLQNFEMEKENARRDERRKAQLDVEKLRADHAIELEEVHRRHERSLSISQQQADMEADNFRKANSGEHQLARLVEQVQGSVAEVGRMSRRVDTDKSLEWNSRERQLDAREKTVREMEARLSAQSKDFEDQQRRVSELVRHMEDSQVDDREALKLERDRLQEEHSRLLALQQGVREADRNNKEALKHAWAQHEDEKHSFQQERLRVEGELQSMREETDLLERHQRQEAEKLKVLHNQVELARQNASRRIRETEATIASERRALMSDLEIFEEKRRGLACEVLKVEQERESLSEERENFDEDVRNVGQMAAEVQRRSEELKALHDQAGEARGEILTLRDQLSEERSAHGSELERLKTMQTMVEQQRLQLLQTENQFRMRGIEDIDLMVTTQATFPGHGSGQPNPFGLMEEEPFSKPAVMSGDAAAPWERQRMPATAGRAGSTGRLPGSGADAAGSSSRLELQTLLRRTKESSGDVLYIQEQFRYLQQGPSNGPAARADRPFPFPAASGGHAGLFSGGARPLSGMTSAGVPAPRGVPQQALGSFPAMPAPSYNSSTEDDDLGGPTLEGMRPLSSHISSGGSGSS